MIWYRNRYDDNNTGPPWRTREEADAAAQVQEVQFGRVRWYLIIEHKSEPDVWEYVGPRPS